MRKFRQNERVDSFRGRISGGRVVAKLTAKRRNKLSSKDFALSGRRYPVEDKKHAKAALSRVSAHGSPEEQAKVRKKVHAKFPEIAISSIKKHKKSFRKRTTRKV